MGIFSNIFKKKQPSSRKPEHAVNVHFSYGHSNLQPIFQLEDQLEEAISRAGVGEYDGNDIAKNGSDGVLYMYGPDGDKLFNVVKPILESAAFMRGATVIIRYGPPDSGVKEYRVKLSF
jgi:hypothetical protein